MSACLSRLFLSASALSLTVVLTSCGSESSPTDPSTTEARAGDTTDESASATDEDDTTTGEPVPAVAPSTEVDEGFIEDTFNSAHSVLAEPTVVRDLSQVLSDQALEDFENQRLELENEGLRMEGEVTIVDERQVDSPGPGTVIKEVCVDNSAVRTLDENGNDVTSPNAQSRSRMLLTFTADGDSWTLSELSFPDDPNC
ncbi:Uncharacterised protein [Corynebacterium pilosum]|uniref:Secreted protein n=1 Tax=Corynebacterium pilosum TaxID=35756 RepID=A0A376CJU5_9CORY|nr:Uncharacterised protein [Corynebacterium pilosum]